MCIEFLKTVQWNVYSNTAFLDAAFITLQSLYNYNFKDLFWFFTIDILDV